MGKKNQLLFFIFDKVIKTKALVPPLRRSQQGSGGGGPPFWTGWGVSPWSPWAQGCEGPRETQAELGEAALMNFLAGKGGVGPLLLGLGDGSPPLPDVAGDRLMGTASPPGWGRNGVRAFGCCRGGRSRAWGTTWLGIDRGERRGSLRCSTKRAPRSWGSCGDFPTCLVLGALPWRFNSPRAFFRGVILT